jgi:hypothetical protein
MSYVVEGMGEFSSFTQAIEAAAVPMGSTLGQRVRVPTARPKSPALLAAEAKAAEQSARIAAEAAARRASGEKGSAFGVDLPVPSSGPGTNTILIVGVAALVAFAVFKLIK